MSINIDQVKQSQRAVKDFKPNHMRPLRLLTVGVVVTSVIIGALFYGNHPQWSTASIVEKASRNAQTKNNAQPVVAANRVQQAAVKQGVTPDYSGHGGLASKADMAKLAQSQQSEILRGHVAVPSFNISEPVYEGTSNHVLAIGAGLNQPGLTFGSGVVSVFAHNLGDYNAIWPYHPTKFSALQNMTDKTIIGQDIYLSDGHTVYVYKATKLEYGIPVGLMNQELSDTNSGKPKVKLIACLEDQEFWQHVRASHYTDFTAQKRIVLTGELVREQSITTVTDSLRTQLK